MPSVLIADDHPMIRTGLRQYLEQDRSIEAIGEAASGAETLQGLRDGRWDLVILDINMPDGSGIEILRQIRLEHPNARVLVVSGFAEKQYAITVLRGGASGYLAKDKAPEEFMSAVRTVLAGRRFVSTSLSELLISELDEPTDQPMHSKLSEREFQVLRQLAVGRSVTEIAVELAISVKTISTYRARVLEKMHLDTNADLTTYALRNGLLQ
jgi:two-component system, NarL family, invasion response regulator UvrY